MADQEHGYDRGWYRYGFDTVPWSQRTIHGGGADVDISLLFNRGVGKPHIAMGIIHPGSETPGIGMHIHRDEPSSTDVEEWYIIIDGTGIQRFSNGDSVKFGPGDLIACYPGTGHSLEATTTVRLISITPNMFTNKTPAIAGPEGHAPRIHVLTTDEAKNPLTAECSVCGATWEQPEGDTGSNTLPTWSVEHDCTEPFTPLHI